MKDIKTRDHVKNIKAIDKSAVVAEHMKSVAIRSKEQAAEVARNDAESTADYGSQQIERIASNAAHDATYVGAAIPKKVTQKTTSPAKKRGAEDRSEGQKTDPPTNRSNPRGRSGANCKKTSAKAKGSRIKQRVQNNHSIKTKSTGSSAAPQKAKTIKSAHRGASPAKRRTAGASKGTAQHTYARSKQIATASARTAAKGARRSAALKKYIKAAAAQIKSLIAALSGGGSIAAIVIILICVIGLILGSSFGILFSGEDTGSGMTIRDAIREINTEYETQLDTIRNNNPHVVVEMSGARAVWKEVLAVYSVRTTTDPDNPQEVVTMTDEKKNLLRNIFWEMNTISSHVSTETRTVTAETVDSNGNTVTESQQVEQKVLYITVVHKTTEEMASSYSFNADQNAQLSELLSSDYASMWNAALYGITASDTAIVDVAISQLGNVGGQPYWSWYGFGTRVEWCACFVSLCSNECGYIDNGIIPKYSYCPTGADWFKQRGQWAERDITPEPGMIIFFDWASRGGQDGVTDHTGIVEKVEDGRVYTIEGNSGNACREKSYPIGWYEIHGYGIPQY